jgi:hypothetical protein
MALQRACAHALRVRDGAANRSNQIEFIEWPRPRHEVLDSLVSANDGDAAATMRATMWGI